MFVYATSPLGVSQAVARRSLCFLFVEIVIHWRSAVCTCVPRLCMYHGIATIFNKVRRVHRLFEQYGRTKGVISLGQPPSVVSRNPSSYVNKM